MTRAILVFLAQFVAVVSCANAQSEELVCTPEKSGITLSSTNFLKTKSLKLKNKSNCDAGYSYYPTKNVNEGILIIGADEPNLNSYDELYKISFTKKTKEFIGRIPTGSESTTGKEFKFILQQGGSLFLEKYTVEFKKSQLNRTTQELIIDGEVCIDDSQNVFNSSLKSDSDCKKKIYATSDKPICLSHRLKTHEINPLSFCKDLVSRWNLKSSK